MSKILERARALRRQIETMAADLDDTTALSFTELYPQWKVGETYKTGDRVVYDGTLYRALQDHTAIEENWNPKDAASLFARVLIPDPDVIPDWEQPDSTNPYMKGDKVRFEGNVYVSLIDNNVWSPAAYPAGWQIIDA